MKKPNFDPGLTQQYSSKIRRVIRKDGEFNVRRRGRTLQDIHPYLYLINTPWYVFLGLLFAGFVATNLMFALIYYWVGGIEQVHNAVRANEWGRFLSAFFFSSETLTTVGYGTIWPSSVAANFIASIESMVGLMGFAVATGFLVGRVSRPTARIGFSHSMIVAPYQDGTSLQFRVVNRSVSNLMELQARVMLMTVEVVQGRTERKYNQLELERDGVLFLPLTWTVVHAIDSNSPLLGKTAADLERLQAEVLILIKGVDDTFSQTVHARYSYRYDEIVWGAKFAPAFEIDDRGDLRLEVDRVSDIIRVPGLNQ
jgi:inward rectifier potassium channel